MRIVAFEAMFFASSEKRIWSIGSKDKILHKSTTTRYGVAVAGWKLCYTQPHPAKGLPPSGLPRNARRCASRIPKAKDMKGRKTEGGGRSATRKWVTIRVTDMEKARLMEQADIAGLSLSEYARRRFFGGTIAACTDVKTVGELRRIGGLLKHNFATLRQVNAPRGIMEKQEEALRKLVWLIQKIGLVLDDRQKNQEREN